MRLIDADSIQLKGIPMDMGGLVYIEDILLKIEELPTVDAVPVVRCGECKWFYESDTIICCEKHKGLALARKDDYCSYGERKDTGRDGTEKRNYETDNR